MATSKPISTISYNTVPFLHEQLQRLYNRHIISAYMFISHKGEDGDKDHIHVRIEPNKVIDPMSISDLFIEPIAGEPKPRRCLKWRPSKEEDWILYAVHDADYLSRKYKDDKNEKLPYKWQDIIADDSAEVETMYIRAKASLTHTAEAIVDSYTRGVSAVDLVRQGEPVQAVYSIARLVNDTRYTTVCQENVVLQDRLSEQTQLYEKIISQYQAKLKELGFPSVILDDGTVVFDD